MKTSSFQNYPIPVFLNTIVILVCSTLYFVLLRAASTTESNLLLIVYGFSFAIVMIPVYSLIHEAEHNMLYPNAWWNNTIGRWLCTLFIVSFTFFKHCHLRHHKKNRTDIEIWELYFEDQVKWRRYGNLYLMMIGLGYLSLWCTVILYAIWPSLVYHPYFQKHKEIAGFLEGSNQEGKVQAMRWESWVVILFQIVLFLLLHLSFKAWIVLYLMHGFLWSSQNYVNHAFSPRDIINGAHNLKIPLWLKPIYLNFNVHLAHHQNPTIPWIHLPKFIKSGPERISFFKNYLRLWKGPKLTHEGNPVVIEDLPLT